MIIQSKFNSICKVCGGPINIGDNCVWTPNEKGVKHQLTEECLHYKSNNPQAATPIKSIDTSMKPVVDVMREVGLKKPSLRFQTPQKQEVALSLTRTGVSPGSVAIKLDKEFIGCIRPDGQLSTKVLRENTELREFLLATITDKDSLIHAAIEYAKLTNHCSFCGLELTNDFSVINGYGPICADKWGLPHALNNTAEKPFDSSIPLNIKAKLLKAIMEEENGE